MAENEVGKGFVSIEPDAKGFGAKTEKVVQSELSGVGTNVGRKVGGDLSSGIGEGLSKSKGGIKGFTDEIVGAFASIPLPVIGAGAAIGAFALKAITDFQNLAIRVGQFSEVSGLAIEDASRWAEVAGDVGISTDQLSTSFRFLLKSIGQNPEKFRALGISAQDSNGQLLQAIDLLNRTPAGAQRAALGVQLFGRSWDQLSELITQGSDALSESLDAVSGAKIIDAAEVEKAKEMRAQLDTLTDAFENMTLTIGQALLPAMLELVGTANMLIGPLDHVVGLLNQMDDLKPDFSFVGDIIGPSLGPLGMIFGTAAEGIAKVNEQSKEEEKQRRASNQAWNEAHGSLRAFEGDMVAVGAASDQVSKAVPTQTQSLRALEDGVRNVAEQYQRAEDAANGYLTAVMATEDSALAQEVAIDRVGDSVRELAVRWQEAATAVDNAKTPQNEMTEAQDAAADAARGLRGDVLGVASAALQAAEDQAALSGATLTAKQRADAQIGALQSLKQQYPQVGQQVDSLIAKINATPPSKTTNVTVTDNGTAGQVQSAIMNINGKSVVVKAIGDFSDFDRNLAARAARAGMQVADTGMIVPGTYSQPFPVIAHGQEVILNPDQQAKVLWEIANGSMTAGGDGASVGAGPTIVIERLYGTVDREFAKTMQGQLRVLERERR